jgi:hypothetical protein
LSFTSNQKKLLSELARQSQPGRLYVDYDYLQRWPAGAKARFLEEGVIIAAGNSDVVRCPGCERGCFAEPSIYYTDSGDCFAELLCRDTAARIEISPEMFERFEVVPSKLKELGFWHQNDKSGHDRYSLEYLGDFWRAVFDGSEAIIKDSKAVRLVSILLEKPHQHIYCVDLSNQLERNHVSKISDFEDSAADKEATDACQEYLEECQAELAEAQSKNDQSAIEEAIARKEAISEHLLKLKGYNGASRSFSSDVERIRKSLTKNIRDFIGQKSLKNLPQFTSHLQNSINTGKIFSYIPEREIDWKIIKNF